MEFINKVLEFLKSDIGSIIATCVVFGFVCFVFSLKKVFFYILNNLQFFHFSQIY